MGLDVYVGPLSRYYSGAWESIVQQEERRLGPQVEVVRPNPFSSDDPEVVRRRVIDWQASLSDILMGSVGRLSWTESATGDYVSDKPDWGPFVALCLLAAHADGLLDALPDIVPTGQPAMKLWGRLGRRTQAPEPFGHRMRRLFGRSSTYAPPPRQFTQIVGPEVWLPLDASVVIETNDALGVRRTFGSVGPLLAELRQLNAQTFRATDATLSGWARDAPLGGAFEPAAHFGLAVMLSLAGRALDRRQPLVLDY
ncbi:MAG TPA: hypothetical protein VFI28_05475 [Candidatus Limnocylindrales bacterium]|nr:hypothetical protein [Candidatus Limnocylindrales bacterium]